MTTSIISPARDTDSCKPRPDECDDHEDKHCFSWKTFIYYIVSALVLTAVYFVMASVQGQKLATKGACAKTSGLFSFAFFLVVLLALWLFTLGGHALFDRHH